MKLNRLWQNSLDVLFPPVCLACKKRLATTGEKSMLVCAACFNQIRTNNGFYCPECGRRLPEPEKTCHPQAKLILAATTSYEIKPARALIQTLKYEGLPSVLKPWQKLSEEYLSKLPDFGLNWRDAIIVPVPIHQTKERQRGFNQADLIARMMAGILKLKYELDFDLPISKKYLIKTKPTKSQTECPDYPARGKNIAGAFSVADQKTIDQKNVVLVDDVFTSGATMKEAARLLRDAGAKKIIGFVLAKT